MERHLIPAILAPAFIALSIIIIKIAGLDTHPLLIAGLSPLIAVPFLFAWLILRKERLQLRLILKDYAKPFLMLLASRCVVGQIVLVLGFVLTSAVKAVLLLRLEPVFVLIWSIVLLGEKPRAAKFLITMILIAGAALVVNPANELSAPNLGDALICLALFFLSYSYIPTQRIMERADALTVSLLANIAGGSIITAIAFALLPPASLVISSKAFGWLCLYALTFFVLGANLYFVAFRTVKPWIIASLLSLEVSFGLLFALIAFAEVPTTSQLLGMVIIVAATIATGVYSKA